MVYINEWLPNPTGKDAEGEWIELFNDGQMSANLRGWFLQTKNGKKFNLSGYEIGPREYLILGRGNTKLAFRNSNEELSLYDGSGKLVDQSVLRGTAPEGKGFARIGDRFLVSDPTPNAVNRVPVSLSIAKNLYPFGEPLHPQFDLAGAVFLAAAVGAILAALIVFVLKKNNDLSELFFGRY